MSMFTPAQIREIRQALKMNSTQFATLLGVTANAVSRWEIGDRRPRWETMEEMNRLVKLHGIKITPEPQPA